MKEMWNERYASKSYFYGDQPNEYFRQFIDANPPGHLLLPAEGEGRNAVYAARKGYQVTAIDFSETARQKALDLARHQKVQLDYQLGDIQNLSMNHNSFDYVACIFMHLPHEQLSTIYHQLISLLKPKGKMLIVGFNKNQLQYASGGPKNENWLFSSDQLKKQLKDYPLLRCFDAVTNLNEGNGHTGPAEITVAEIGI